MKSRGRMIFENRLGSNEGVEPSATIWPLRTFITANAPFAPPSACWPTRWTPRSTDRRSWRPCTGRRTDELALEAAQRVHLHP